MIKIEVDSVDVDIVVVDIDFVVLLNETEDIRFIVDVVVSFFEVVLLKLTYDVICWKGVVLNSVAKTEKKIKLFKKFENLIILVLLLLLFTKIIIIPMITSIVKIINNTIKTKANRL